MSKKITIITSIILLIIMLGIIFFIYNSNKKNKAVSLENQSTVYEKNSAIVYDISNPRELIETIEDTTIQGIVELNHNGYIYIFNGQHFGEYGFEMEEYTSSSIDNKNQECIDYFTSEKYDTNYIQEGDILICKGDLKKYSLHNDLDTKNNPIIVLKAHDYDTMKKETIDGKRKTNITVGDYFDNDGEIYIKYDISDGKYKLPFVLKFKITKDTNVIGELKKGKTVKIEYKDLSVPVNELELKQIEVVK